jgi:molybdate transport system permease protein
MDWQALLLSLKLASSSTAALLALGLPFTYWLSRRQSRWVNAVEAVFSLPMVLPPTVLGFYLLLVLGPWGWAFSFGGLFLASFLSGMPFAFQSFLAGFRSVNKVYLDNSRSLGESEIFTFLRVAIPLAFESIASGAILSFAHALGEFGVVLMIGGNIPGVSRTLSLSLYDQVSAFDYRAANQTALLLLLFSAAASFALSLLRAKERRHET